MALPKDLNANVILKCMEARPDFLKIDIAKQRGTKNSATKYMDALLVRENGSTSKLGIAWDQEPLRGAIKPMDERKFPPTLNYRSSSGALGKALVGIYGSFTSQIAARIADKSINVKPANAIIRSAVQNESDSGEKLEDSIIRIKLPFKKNGDADFKLAKIIIDESGNPKPVYIKCTEQNIHTLITGRTMTSGYATMEDVIFSTFGISMPIKIKLLVIKPMEFDSPEVDAIMSREEMLAMAGSNVEVVQVEQVPQLDGVEDEVSVEDQLEALKLMSNGGE
jgi:hypothetical protein